MDAVVLRERGLACGLHEPDHRAVVAIVGIRPGEKIHELMCPKDDSMHVIEFNDFFIIRPSITFNSRSSDCYKTTMLGEQGKPVELGFEYNSKNNPNFLNVEEIRDFLQKQEK